MNTMHGFKILATAGAVLALAGCLGADQKSEAEMAREKRVTFVNETSLSAVQAANISVGPGNEEIAASLDALGCPKLSNLFTDLSTFQGTLEQPLPASFIEYLACFGINGNGTLDDIDVITAKLNNPTELLDCICGGTALSDLYFGGDFSMKAFQGSSSSAAGEAFDGKSSSGAGSSFDGKSSSGAGSKFDGKSSSGAGSSFSDK